MSPSQGDLPNPSPEFFSKALSLVSPPNLAWVRIYWKKFGPCFFSQKELSRWDIASGPYGAMCVGDSFDTAFLEVFGDTLRIEDKKRALTGDELDKREVATITIPKDIKVLDIRNSNLVRLSLDSRIFSGAYTVSRNWSKAFMEHPAKPQGVLYNSRHNPENTNLVIFGKPPGGVPPLSHHLEVAEIQELLSHKELRPTFAKYDIGYLNTPKMIMPPDS